MKKNGFTLIELMVTISIIGLLAAIALPRFNNVTEDAKVANVQANLTNLRTAAQMYMAKTEKRSVHDMFDVYTEDVKPEFQEFYSKATLPEIVPGKNLDYTKKGIIYASFPYSFATANDNSGGGNGAENYAFFAEADGDDFNEVYAFLQPDTYGANIDWEQF